MDSKVESSVRLLFDMDRKDHEGCTHEFVRNSARAVIIRDGKIAMVHSLLYDYYKFPGGGIEKGEDPIAAVIRETREEAGLAVLPDSVKEYGCVHRAKRSGKDPTERFIQDNFYYICSASDDILPQKLDSYEEKERFTLEFTDPRIAIEKNRAVGDTPYDKEMFEREAGVLELLIKEGYFD